jgi:hypothetical protein
MDCASHNKACQRDRLLALLRSRAGDWVPLPDILALGIAQYSARIYELRREGYRIESKGERRDGVRYTWFRLATNPTLDVVSQLRSIAEPPTREKSLFGDLSPAPRYPD